MQNVPNGCSNNPRGPPGPVGRFTGASQRTGRALLRLFRGACSLMLPPSTSCTASQSRHRIRGTAGLDMNSVSSDYCVRGRLGLHNLKRRVILTGRPEDLVDTRWLPHLRVGGIGFDMQTCMSAACAHSSSVSDMTGHVHGPED